MISYWLSKLIGTNFPLTLAEKDQIQGSQVMAERLNDKKVFTRNMCFFKKLHNFDDDIKNKRPTNGEIDIYYDSFSISVFKIIQ